MEDIQNRSKTGELDKIKAKFGRGAPDLTDLCSLSQMKMLKVQIAEEGMIPYDDAIMPGKLKRLHGANEAHSVSRYLSLYEVQDQQYQPWLR